MKIQSMSKKLLEFHGLRKTNEVKVVLRKNSCKMDTSN
jgi:hypothetical protein